MSRYEGPTCLALVMLTITAWLGWSRANAQSLAGSWRGPVSQLSISSLAPTSFYPTAMTLDGIGKGTIDYPTLGCGGILSFIETSGLGFVYRERLRYGYKEEHRRCIDGGTVIVIPQGNSLRWSWSGSDILVSGLLLGQTRIFELSCQACGPRQLRDADACTRSGDMFDQNRCMDRVSREWHSCLSTCRH
jgi:hypothetical protein